MQAHLRRQVAALAGLALAGALGLPAGDAAAQQPRTAQATVTTEVPVGQHRSMRLRNVPKDARIGFAVQVSGPLVLSLLNEADAKRHPQPPGEALFTAPVSTSLSFSVTAPAAGDYYLLLDNRQGTAPAKARILVQAARGASAPTELPPTRPFGDRPAPPLPLRERTPMHEM